MVSLLCHKKTPATVSKLTETFVKIAKQEMYHDCIAVSKGKYMQREIRLASFNVRNLVLPEMVYYDELPAYTQEQYQAKTAWIADCIDKSGADIIGFQEIFSKEALHAVMAKTQRYRNATLICFDQNDPPSILKPQVALISLLPLAGTPVSHGIFPEDFRITLPITDTVINRFSRPVLEAPIMLPNGHILNVYVVHLKSKRPDYVDPARKADPYQYGLASLRSLMRRAADALGIRTLVSEFRQNKALPVAILGDFNDFSYSVSTGIITGKEHESEHPLPPSLKLYDCFDIQTEPARPIEPIARFIEADGTDRIDHIFVSEEFTETSGYSEGRVKTMLYQQNGNNPAIPESSDHHLALATIALHQTGS